VRASAGPGSGPGAEDSRLRRVLIYGASKGTSHALLGLRGLVVATLLGPAGFGGWALFRLALNYSAAADLGALHGLELEVAQEEADAPAEGARIGTATGAATALGFNVVVFLFLAAAALGASFLVADPGWRAGLRGFSAAALAERVWMYGLVYLRALGRVRRYSALELLHGVLHLALATVGTWRWGLSGAFGGFAVASLVSVGLLVRDVPLRPALSRRALGRLLRVGAPLLVSVALFGLLATVDRLLVAAYGGTALLGHYAFAAAVAGLAAAAVWAVRTVVFPDVYGAARLRGAGPAVRGHLDETVLPFARLFPAVLGGAAFGIGPAVAIFLPEYRPAIAPARLFLFTGVTFGFATLGSLSLAAADRQGVLPVQGAAALLLNVGLSVAALELGWGLVGVAGSALLSQSAFGAGILAVSATQAGESRPWRFAGRALAPLAYCALSVLVVGTLLPGPELGTASAGLGLYLVTLLPLAPLFWRSVRALRRQASAGTGVTDPPACPSSRVPPSRG